MPRSGERGDVAQSEEAERRSDRDETERGLERDPPGDDGHDAERDRRSGERRATAPRPPESNRQTLVDPRGGDGGDGTDRETDRVASDEGGGRDGPQRGGDGHESRDEDARVQTEGESKRSVRRAQPAVGARWIRWI